MSYACLAHGRTGDTPEKACPECRTAQIDAQAGAGKSLLFFRNLAHAVTPVQPNPLATLLQGPEASAPQPEVKNDVPQGPRLAGIDPGLRWIAITVAEAGAPLRFVVSTLIEVVPSKGPKAALSDDDMDAALVQVVAFLEAHAVERAAVERATHFHGGDAPPGILGARAAGLLRGQWVGGLIAGALRAAHRYDASGALVRSVAHVASVRAKDWRDAARKPSPQAPWQDGVRAAFGGTLPEQPGEHVLDAAGICAWLIKPPSPKRNRALGARRERSAASRNGARDAEQRKAMADRAAARAAAGCTCAPRGRPSRLCPAYASYHAAGGK